uniref:Uncharacterized protein n=1 Tax=Mycena chlorophos TaxID=658473 RepID=A0ABQ0M4Q5_MYCCL|nr:predicted protein [Mycena chlorophos]
MREYDPSPVSGNRAASSQLVAGTRRVKGMTHPIEPDARQPLPPALEPQRIENAQGVVLFSPGCLESRHREADAQASISAQDQLRGPFTHSYILSSAAMTTMQTQGHLPPSNTHPATMPSSWLAELLATTKKLKAPDYFPAAEGVFIAVMKLLEAVKACVVLSWALQPLCQAIGMTVNVLHSIKPENTMKIKVQVAEFQGLLEKIVDKVKKLPSKDANLIQRAQQLFFPTSKLQKYYTRVIDLHDNWMEGPEEQEEQDIREALVVLVKDQHFTLPHLLLYSQQIEGIKYFQ